jgi:anti-sigma regulatory factor (Ser/Thr protein kinase)
MTDVVELTIPVKADLVVLARLTAATVASRANFDVEEIEDLRLAVDELCISLVQGLGDGRLDLQFTRDDDSIEVSCSFRTVAGDHASGLEDESLGGLSARILDALVDEHGEDGQDGERRAWLRKRRAPPPDG